MGRWSNEKRAQMAAEAASRAGEKARTATPPSEPAGASEPAKVEGARPPARNEPRRLAMEEIRAARGEPKDEPEEQPAVSRETTPKAEVSQTPAAETEPQVAKAEPATATPATEPAAETLLPPKMVKVKVDGVESEVPQADVDAAGGVTVYQRDKAAENRLAKANQTLAESKRIQAQIAQWIQQQAPKEPTLTDDQFIQSKVDIIRFGTPEESAVALREVLQRSNPKIDPNTITQQAVNQMNKQLAVDNFKKEFQDVVSNPLLLKLAASLEAEGLPKAGQQTDWQTYYRNIGNQVRSVVGRPSQPQPPALATTTTTDSTSPVDKEARKASIVNLPTAAARAALPAEEKPETREESLNRMRKARGLPLG